MTPFVFAFINDHIILQSRWQTPGKVAIEGLARPPESTASQQPRYRRRWCRRWQ